MCSVERITAGREYAANIAERKQTEVEERADQSAGPAVSRKVIRRLRAKYKVRVGVIERTEENERALPEYTDNRSRNEDKSYVVVVVVAVTRSGNWKVYFEESRYANANVNESREV